MDSKLWVLLNPASDQVHKHSETALDTLKKEGTESSFPVKMHLIVLHKACLSVKFHDFTDKAVKNDRPIRKMAGFYGRLKETCSNCSFCGAKSKRKNRKSLKIKDLRFVVPGAGIEPARIAPLVFETSASTDSAIRAFALLTQPFSCFSVTCKCRLCIDETKLTLSLPGLKESAEG